MGKLTHEEENPEVCLFGTGKGRNDPPYDEIIEDFIQTRYGYCFYEVEQGRNAIIFNLYVHHQYRRHGHARELLQYCINQIRKSGHDGKIDIEVAPREESISCENLARFYESMGLNVLWRDEE